MASEAVIQKRPLIVRIGKKLRPWFNKVISRDSRISNAAVLDPHIFPWAAALEKASALIAQEFEAVMAERNVPSLRDLSPDHVRIAPDQRWKTFFLYGYGVKASENCAKAPITAQLVDGIPGLNTALFSILDPHGEIPPHNGVTKGLLNFHLGLRIPKERDKCWIKVEDQLLHWEEGRAILFDDTYKHSVKNETDELRAVLFIQVERPTRGLGRVVQKLFLEGVRRSAFVKDARASIRRWNTLQSEMERA